MKRAPALDDDERLEIAQRILANQPLSIIAGEYGVSYNRVHRIKLHLRKEPDGELARAARRKPELMPRCRCGLMLPCENCLPRSATAFAHRNRDHWSDAYFLD